MIKESDLIRETEEFINRYWNYSNENTPSWLTHWRFDGTIPNHEIRGCYALFEEENIVYIGVGIGKSFGRYEGNGLGDRLKRYWKLNKSHNTDKKYEPAEDWKNITSIMTIGFDDEHYPLAAALEIFLINRLKPEKNKQHKK